MENLSGVHTDMINKGKNLFQQYKSHCIAAAIVIVSIFIARNTTISWQREKREFDKRKVEMSKLTEIQDKVRSAEKEMKEYQSKLLEDDSFRLKTLVEDISRDAQLKILTLKPGNGQDFSLYRKLEINLSMVGDYPELIRFMSRIEDLAVPVQVESLQVMIQRTAKKEDPGLSIEVKIVGYASK